MRSGESEEVATPPGTDSFSQSAAYYEYPDCLKHEVLKQRLVSCDVHSNDDSQYAVLYLATSIQHYRTMELLFKASSSSGLWANASLAS